MLRPNAGKLRARPGSNRPTSFDTTPRRLGCTSHCCPRDTPIASGRNLIAQGLEIVGHGRGSVHCTCQIIVGILRNPIRQSYGSEDRAGARGSAGVLPSIAIVGTPICKDSKVLMPPAWGKGMGWNIDILERRKMFGARGRPADDDTIRRNSVI